MNEFPRVLIVDDEEAGRETLKALLLQEEYELLFAADGAETLAQAAAKIPDLILLDVMMPGMNGYEVCRRLRADPHLAEVPIIMITALDDRESRLQGIEAGADDFISKPFDRLELKARVRTITRLNRYRRLLLERSYRQQAEEEVYHRSRDLQVLDHVITTSAAAFDIHDTLYVACEELALTFQMPQAAAVLLNRERNKFVTSVEYRQPVLQLEQTETEPASQPSAQAEGLNIPLVGLLSEYLSVHKHPLIIVGQQRDPQLAQVEQLMHQHGIGSLLVAPILLRQQIAGLIELQAPERRNFREPDVMLIQSVATAVGQAVENVRLYQSLQHHIDELEAALAQERGSRHSSEQH